MGSHALSRQQFETFGATRVTRNGPVRQIVEWFADQSGVLLGTIADEEAALEWSFIILERDINGKFHIVHCEARCPSLDQARRVLFDKMETVLAAGKHQSLALL
jgi:hypothetical protein